MVHKQKPALKKINLRMRNDHCETRFSSSLCSVNNVNRSSITITV